MDDTMYCLVDRQGTVHVRAGAASFGDVAREYGLDEAECQEYRFDFSTRRLLVDRATPATAIAAQACVEQRVGTPERLMEYATEGHVPKHVLAALLDAAVRPTYLEACARIERQYTTACAAKQDPCLESGCSVEGEDETCLQPLLAAGVEYHQTCAAEWVKLFCTAANRIDAWKN